MSHQDYIDDCNEDQLKRLIELAQDKAASYNNRKKTKYLAVCDDWMNIKHFRRDDADQALACFAKTFRAKVGNSNFEKLSIEIVKYFPEEIEDML